MLEIEIDGKQLKAQEGSTIIEVADDAGIYIPRFCYHKKLSIAANCRMCLVEVEKVGKPLPACATPVTAGMKIFTRSKKALEAQRAVMEFLLINHPLDCPICDQGGECELQDLSMGFGRADSNYCETKRSVASEDIGPLIETWMTRCIHCTRCVRFGEEIAGLREMGVTGRGEHSEIGTYVKHFLQSELSGNIIDICPVGALTNKPARYAGRAWEYTEHASISPHDAVGSHLFVHSRAHQLVAQRDIMRAVPRENEQINETWISDRDRYSVHGLYHKTRIYKPMIRRNENWIEVDWQRALDEIADRLKTLIDTRGADQIAALAHPSSSIEELYLLQKLMRALGIANIDHRLREHDFSDQEHRDDFPKLGLPIAEVEQLNVIVLIGSDIRHEQPMLAHRMNKAVGENATVIAINPIDFQYTFPVEQKIIVHPNQIALVLAQIAKALAEVSGETFAELHAVPTDARSQAIAATLMRADKVGLFVGELAAAHPQAAEIRALVQLIARLSKASFSLLSSGANTAGACLAGVLPHRGPAMQAVEKVGLTAKEVLTDKPMRGYFLLNTELEFDCAYPHEALRALAHAGLVVCLTPFVSEEMRHYAHFILPIAPFTETAGTFVNAEGKWQGFSAISEPHKDAKPAWKVLRVLANFLFLKDFDYKTAHEVQFEIKSQVEKNQLPQKLHTELPAIKPQATELHRLAPWPMYRVDSLVRRSEPLQAMLGDEIKSISINHKTAEQLNLISAKKVTATQGDSSITLPLIINDRLADNTVLLPSGLDEVLGFGEAEMPIKLTVGA